MALQHLRSSTASKRPLPSGMSDGQLAINTNTASPGLFFKDSAGALIKVGPVHVGTTAPNASPASGGQTGNTVGEQWLDTTGGTYVFKVWDGSAWRSETGTFVEVNGDTMTGALGIIAGSAATPGLFFSGDTNTGIYSPGADQVAISTNGTGRLHITSDGKVGISTPLPAGNFGVNGSSFFGNQSSTGTTGGVLRVNPSTSSIYLQTGTNTSTGSSAALVFSNINAANEWMRITSDGKLGLGTSAPATALEVAGAGTIRGSASGDNTYPQYQLRRTGSTTFTDRNWTTFIASNGNFQIKDESAGLDRLIITTGGNVGVGTTNPDLRITVQEDNPGRCINLLSNDGNGGGRIGTTGEATTSNGLLLNANRGSGSLQFQTGSLERARIDSSGRLLVGTSSDSGGALLQVNGNRVRIATAKTPASASDTGTTGEVCWDASYIYVCTATNTWKRAALSTW